MSECNHDCASCNEKCDERELPKYQMNINSSAKKVYAIVSGKGGVGKSSVTSLIASAYNTNGNKVGILDADITGPSIPKAFGITNKASGSEEGIYPELSKEGVRIMSTNLLLENNNDPVIWRGPVVSGIVKQFYEDVLWDDLDYLFIDMPPGTGDIPLTVFQSVPIDGIIIVTSPQDLVKMIVEKAVKMAQMMNIPIAGIIENYSYFHCPDNNIDYKIFGDSHIEEIAKAFNLKVLAKLPIDPNLAKLCDEGKIEDYQSDGIKSMVEEEKL